MQQYTYSNTGNRPNGTWNLEVGYGLLDAYAAVQQAISTPTLDLWMKDMAIVADDGSEPPAYAFNFGIEQSPDLWVRNQDDGLPTHQNPAFDGVNNNTVYVRVRNRGGLNSNGAGMLKLHWTKSATGFSWPSNWNGNTTTSGGLIGSQPIPALAPGQSTILKFSWSVPDPAIHLNWNS